MPAPDSEFFAEVAALAAMSRDATPKYLRICRTITEAIESGRLRPGLALPSQRDMAEHLGVTVMTLRQALGVLVEQDHLRVEHGLGTFVADNRYHLPIDRLTSFTDQIHMAGRALHTEVLHAGPMAAPHGVQARMGLDSDQLFCLTRLRLVDGVPLVYSLSLLPWAIGQALDVRTLGNDSLYDALSTQLDIRIARAVESFRAALLEEDEAAALRLPVGSATLVSSRLTYASNGLAVVDDRAFMPAESVVVSTERRTADPAVQLVFPDSDDLESVTSITAHLKEKR